MITTTQKTGGRAPREYDVTLGIRTAKTGIKVKFVGNPRTDQEWEWTESDQPGLYDFLRGLLRAWHRPAVKGNKFPPGRQSGTGGPIRKAIARLLTKTPTMKNPELWGKVTAKPPRGWTAYDNRTGKYLEGPTSDDHMVQRRFFTVCGEERKKLK